jgi:predicted secreted protein
MKNKFLKLGMVATFVLSASALSAQQVTTSVGKQAQALPGSTTGYVKVIDNKGSIKYLQSKNGITQFTDNTPDGGLVTTWQLGGVLSDDVNITTGTQEFKLTLNDGTNQGTFVLDGVVQEAGIAADGTTVGTSGWTLLSRDEATGEVKKLLASDLVSGIRVDYPQPTNASADVPITVTGLPVLAAGTTAAKLFVYRNGAKLRSGTDFVATADTVTITYSATDMPMYAGDIVEIQYIK